MNDRGRVPFALVGVLLLVGSATFAASQGGPRTAEPDVDEAMRELVAETQTAVRTGVTTAARGAARDPLIETANTPMGDVVRDSRPFRDGLRIRIYTRVRASLDRLDRRTDGLAIEANLPTPTTPAELRRATERVQVASAGPNGVALAARVDGVTLTIRRDGRVVGRRTLSPSVVVRTPVLAAHRRVQRFERRLNNAPHRPGLGRRLTARLYPIAWARGYAQYGGQPVENVVANRHVALMTNGALLEMQEATFGGSDPVGERALVRATGETAVTDLLAGTDSGLLAHLRQAREEAGRKSPLAGVEPVDERAGGPQPEDDVSLAINETADDTFVKTVADLDEILRQTYTAAVRRTTTVERTGGGWLQRPTSPGENWTLVDTDSETKTTASVGPADSGTPPAGDWHLLLNYDGRVERQHTRTWVWRTDGGRVTTRARRVERYAVTITVAGRHTRGPAPVRPIDGVHRPGGALDGPNLADIRPKAHEELIASAGGAAGLAKRAIDSGGGTETRRITGDRPAGLSEWIYRDLAALRQQVRNVSVTTTRGAIATFEVNAAAQLRDRLDERRDTLADVPAEFDGVADRARVGARVVYLDAVRRRLDDRADGQARRRGKLDESLSDRTSLATLQHAYRQRNDRRSPDELGISMTVDAGPSYLTRTAVGRELAPGVDDSGHPLAVRNVNVVSPPYGNIADAIVGAIFGPKRVRLRTAAQVLRIAERAGPAVSATPSVREQLRSAVDESTRSAADAMRRELWRMRLGNRTSRRAVVEQGLARWNTTAGRALAVSNGSAARSVAAAADERWETLDGTDRDLLEHRLEATLRDHRDRRRIKVEKPLVNETSGAVESAVRAKLKEKLAGAINRTTRRVLERLTGRTLTRLPMGVPVAPVPGFWYATVNLWHVQVRGEYARFVVRIHRGSGDRPGSQFAYTRDGGTVTVDVDSDGTPETLGTSTRVSFRTFTDIAVAVPPGPQGVGDANGQTVETSPGWPDPGWRR
jgi:hypothetical protein